MAFKQATESLAACPWSAFGRLLPVAKSRSRPEADVVKNKSVPFSFGADPPAVMAEPGNGGAGHSGVGGLVQPSAAAGAHWEHATGRRSRSDLLLSATHRVHQDGVTHTKEPPEIPGGSDCSPHGGLAALYTMDHGVRGHPSLSLCCRCCRSGSRLLRGWYGKGTTR